MERLRILLCAPSSGVSHDGASRARWLSSCDHDVTVLTSMASGCNFNNCWSRALTAGKAKEYDLVAMQHGDIDPWPDDSKPRWLDLLVPELLRFDADLVSVAMAIKDGRGVTSCGVGNPINPWSPLRRVTVWELDDLPKTFSAADFGYPGFPLLHNNGCWVADLRKPLWYRTGENGEAIAYFKFPERCYWNGNVCVREGESEDWFFSRMLHNAGAKTYVTSAVQALHMGGFSYPNFGRWGEFREDQDTASVWRQLK